MASLYLFHQKCRVISLRVLQLGEAISSIIFLSRLGQGNLLTPKRRQERPQ